MMINTIRLSKIVQNIYLVSRKHQYVAKLFQHDRKSIIADNRIGYSVFFDYLDSTRKNNSRDLKQKMCIRSNNNARDIKYCRKLWKQDLDKETIDLMFDEVDPVQLRQSINDIDVKCVNIIKQLTAREILEYLIIFLKIYSLKTVRTKFYVQSIDILKTALKRNQLNHQDTMKLLFFASLRKSSRVSDVKFIMNYMLPISELSLIEKSIVTNIVFKCSIKLSRIQARILEETIENNSTLLVKETFWLVPLCKAVRHAGPSKEFTMNNLSQALINAEAKFDLAPIAHIVSLYAEAYYKNADVLSRLFNDAFNDITEGNTKVRLKDIDRLLWAGRILNYPLERNRIDIIDTLLDQRFHDFKVETNLLVNILLSLWMFGHRPVQIVKECFKREIFVSILKDKTLWKPVARLNLLLSCIKLEAPEIHIPDRLYMSDKVGLKINSSVKSMFRELNVVKDDLRLSNLELNCPIEGMYIPGISAKYNEITDVHIDLLDESTCLRDSNEPQGLMNLKLRLLSKIGYQSILVSEKEIRHPEIFRNYLNNKLNAEL